MTTKKDNPIQRVARITGLSPHVIRVWEKRYQAVTPERSDTNRRFYNETDIDRLQKLANLTRDGYRISQVAKLSLEELKKLEEAISKESELPSGGEESVPEILRSSLVAIEKLNSREFEMLLAKATVYMNPLKVVENLMEPLLEEINKRRRQGTLRLLHERFAAATMRPFAVNLMRSYQIANYAPRLISTTPAGQAYEFGALFALTAAAAAGWDPTYIGANLPAEEIAAAVHELKPKVISLNIVSPKNDPMLFGELQNLRNLLPPEIKILVGGSGAVSYLSVLDRIGAQRVASFSQLLGDLSDLSSGEAPPRDPSL